MSKEKTKAEKIKSLQEVAQGAPTLMGGPPPDVEALVDSSGKKGKQEEVEVEIEPSELGNYKSLRFCVFIFFALILIMMLIPLVGFILALLGRLFH